MKTIVLHPDILLLLDRICTVTKETQTEAAENAIDAVTAAIADLDESEADEEGEE